MRISYIAMAFMMSMVLGGTIASASIVGTSSIHAPAVILENNTGVLTNISLTVTTGNGIVRILGPQQVGNSTLDSAIIAAHYAAQISKMNESNYDFNYTIYNSSNVTGPSGGAALTLLAISALNHRQISSSLTITGTISPNGAIGEIGGAYDKAGAAAHSGMRAILVPNASFDSFEEKEYLLAQSHYLIPLIQVSNISQAEAYMFGQKQISASEEVNYSLGYNYNLTALTNATVSCSTSCNYTPFNALGGYTINMTAHEVKNSTLSSLPLIRGELSQALSQSESVLSKGYVYTGSDLAFLDYINAYMFSNFNTSRHELPLLMQGVQNYCEYYAAPQLTVANYQYIIAAEMRQGWGNYTIAQDISSYNISQSTSDEVLGSTYLAGESNAWCNAASYLYNHTYAPSDYLVPSISLSSVAASRIARAAQYHGMYLQLANASYAAHNYPVAILDADYAYAFGYSSEFLQQNATYLNSRAAALAANATYGVWATEFSKESQFYTKESILASNSTIAEGYAQNAFTVAFLASQLSKDTSLIYNMSAKEGYPSTVSTGSTSPETNLRLSEILGDIYSILALLVILIVLLIITMIILFVVLTKLASLERAQARTIRKNR